MYHELCNKKAIERKEWREGERKTKNKKGKSFLGKQYGADNMLDFLHVLTFVMFMTNTR